MASSQSHKNSRTGKAAKIDRVIVLAEHFARQLAALRASRSETQKQLASRLGMTESMISRLETGEHLPSLTTLCRIAEAFDCTLEISFHEHEHEHPDGVRHTHAHGPGHSSVSHHHGDK